MHNELRLPPATQVRPHVILATCCMSLLMVSMDVTIVNVALPAIRRDLHTTVAGLQWSIDGYTVVVASFLLLAGSMADRLGRRRTFQAGLALFSAGSLLCSLAPSTTALVAFRMLQALGGAMLNPVAMSIIVNTFTDPKERARAIGIWGAVFGVSMAIGPLVGGVLTQSVGWRSIFWINVPIGIAAFALTARFVPESLPRTRRRFDLVGQSLIVVALASLTSGVIDGRRSGWGSPEIAGCFAAAVASVIALVAYEARRREPLLDLRFFRSLPFSSATVIAVLAFASFSGFLFLNSLYLQDTRRLQASVAGLCTLPIALAMVLSSPLSGRLVGAGHARFALVAAGCAMATGALLLTSLRPDTPMPLLVVAYAVFGVGLGMVNAPITNAAVSGMPRAQAGTASAVASTSRQVGASLGVALAGSIAGEAIRPGFASSTHPVWWLTFGLGLAIAALGLASTGARARASAARVAYLLDARDDGPPRANASAPRATVVE
jgi:EmrB/QacA subfamily drug resistance transporter